MWLATDTANVYCPYCGEPIELVIDWTEPAQQYIEDCFVCCRPMTVSITVVDEFADVILRAEDEIG